MARNIALSTIARDQSIEDAMKWLAEEESNQPAHQDCQAQGGKQKRQKH